ncbi:cell cycle negative regulator roughex-like isoform X2 [Drosophila serrata]|uniref:cell cycle negative regulator roughex-like isoform X2 n=1 Tax=Drosophila serrata TaxID=7274 RepID=UPI000A1D19F7|nr:cell cycle negative regulator roughex-like isoform X2 [Drosophila serrata]
MEESLGEENKTVAVNDGTPELMPLKVVQKFIAANKYGFKCQELAKNYILSFLKRTYVPWMSGKNVPAFFQHKGFKHAAFLRTSEAESHKWSLKSKWMRNHWIVEQKARHLAEAPSLHLRAGSDDEERPPTPMLRQPPKPKLDLDNVTFVASHGVLRKMCRRNGCPYLEKPIKVKLTLGYRLVPLGFDNGQSFEICLAIYEEVPEPVLSEFSNFSGSFNTFDSSDTSDSSGSDIVTLVGARKRRSAFNAKEGKPERKPARNVLLS